MPTKQQFFSIIIPAHNEERYIESTLEHVRELDYPKSRFEVIVVENGSTDRTLAKAKDFEGGNITVMSSLKKGVSVAKNLGIAQRAKESSWTIFLDADTQLKRNFLKELNAFLAENENSNYSIGTTGIRPNPSRAKARAWFAFYDIGHRLTKASYSIQVARNSAIIQFYFDERMTMGEDIELIQFARKAGKFFFFPTKDVYTSTRRFDEEGWWKTFFSWILVAVLPSKMKRRFAYRVVR